ncbi:MAG: hypothetical protein JXD23_05905 [Spirochaetales bacterium]|nr:hypothetical protein [Spirochaetales bacterium]
MGSESNKAGKLFEDNVEKLLTIYKLGHIKSYDVRTITGKRTIDFVIPSRLGKVIIEAKYRAPKGQNAALKYAAEDLFTVMYEYRLLFPQAQLIAIVNDLGILQPGNHDHLPLLTSIGVEVFTINENGKPDKQLLQKLEELSTKYI